MAVSVLSHFLTVPCVGLQCVIVVFPIHTYLLFCNEIQYHITYNIKNLASHISLESLIYVTYCHTDNKKIINTRNDVGCSILLLNFNIILINGV